MTSFEKTVNDFVHKGKPLPRGKDITICSSWKSRWELYLLAIKVGDPFKSKFRIAIEGLQDLLFPKKLKARFV